MKKIFFLLSLIVLALPIFGQVDPPENVVDVVSKLDIYAGSLLGLAFLSTWVTGALNGFLNIDRDWIKQVISWVVPLGVVLLVTLVIKVGFLVGEPVIIVVLYGLGAGLASNGIFDINFIHTGVKWLEDLIKN